VLGYLRAEPRITEAFRTGEGVGWHEHDDDVFVGCDAFYRPGYVTELVPNWIPALEGVVEKLTAGARVADVGCGLGSSSVLLGQAYPRSTVVGRDYHAQSIELARKKAAEAGVADRVTFEVGTAQTLAGTGYDLVTTFDCLHDMGDPLGAARRIREALARTAPGWWSSRTPADTVEGTLNPVGRLYYNGSLFLCLPNALSQPAATPSARRPARPRSGRSPPRRASPASGARRRPRSIWCTRSGPDCRTSPRSRGEVDDRQRGG
jgi:SAM-dependent methyltransferase